MPLYEYDCPIHGVFEKLEPMRGSGKGMDYYAKCPGCGHLAGAIVSVPATHQHGWGYLKDRSEKSPPAPTGSQFEPLWDQAYGP